MKISKLSLLVIIFIAVAIGFLKGRSSNKNDRKCCKSIEALSQWVAQKNHPDLSTLNISLTEDETDPAIKDIKKEIEDYGEEQRHEGEIKVRNEFAASINHENPLLRHTLREIMMGQKLSGEVISSDRK